MWQWVITTASTFVMPSSNAAMRISGGVSIRNAVVSVLTYAPVLRRLSRGSDDVHVGHVQPICGTPTDVPVPRNWILSDIRPVKYLSLPVCVNYTTHGCRAQAKRV